MSPKAGLESKMGEVERVGGGWITTAWVYVAAASPARPLPPAWLPGPPEGGVLHLGLC